MGWFPYLRFVHLSSSGFWLSWFNNHSNCVRAVAITARYDKNLVELFQFIFPLAYLRFMEINQEDFLLVFQLRR